MTDLHQRLLAAIDAEETIAKAAWRGNGWRVENRPDEVWTGLMAPGHTPIPIGRMWDPPTAIHIAAQDPTTTLRRLAEDRDVLARHSPKPIRTLPSIYQLADFTDACAYEYADGNGWIIPWPQCPDILSVARRLGIDS